MSCKFRKKPYHLVPVTFHPGLPQGHTKDGGVGEGLGTDDLTLCRDATSKTEKRLGMKAWHSKFHHSYLPQGRGFLSAQPLSLLILPWAPNALPVCTFHIPLAYQRDINTFLAWHSRGKSMPKRYNYTPNSLKVKYGPSLSGDTGNT